MDSDTDESSSSDLVGQYNPNLQILCNHLKDPTFVEYLNSFLLLPAFSNKLFYNKDTGYFEQVHNDGMVCWDGAVTPSSSLSTLYLPQDTIGASLDKEQSLQWIFQHRLPLFFKSDLFSEYKISKLLSCLVPEKSVWKHRTSISTPLMESSALTEKESSSTLNLPEISYQSISESVSTVDLEVTSKPSGIPASRSDAVLETKKVGRRVRWHRSLSVDPEVLAAPGSGSEILSLSSVNSDTTYTSRRTKSEPHHDRQFLCSKSDMTALWKFLKGKAGERNWLFWLDAERIKYYSNDEDQQRLVKDLRERYLHSGSPLELPAETNMRIKLSKSSQLTIEQIAELQDAMITKLKDYWCPRFLLHCFKEQDTSASSSVCSSSYITSKAPTVFRSCSTAPAAFHGLSDTKQNGYSKVITPLTPTHTPTYRKLGRDRPKSSIAFYHRPEKEYSNSADVYFADNTSDTLKGHGVASLLAERLKEYAINDSPLRRKKWTRKVWGTGRNSPVPEPQKTNTDGGGGGGGGGKTESSAAKYSQLAKYALHHLPDPESKCASRMEGSLCPDDICKNQCRVLSVSGTPTHTASFNLRPASTTDASKTAYEPLLRCLAMEHRKAGGYFMQHLEKLKDPVYINCLQFWREVQEYKALFIQVNFSPCAVEMKAKTLFGRYICECCTKAIQCSHEVIGTISANLWPAYEDLFDEAEEHALDILLSQWNDLCNSEDTTFQKLETIQLASHLGGTLTESTFNLSDIERYSSGGGGSVSASSSGAISLDMILNNMTELEHFKIFLNKNCAAEDLMCWMDIEAFRGVPVTDRYVRNVRAKQLRKQYMNKGYFFGSNSPATKEGQRQTKLAGGVNAGARLPARPRTPVFREAQKHVRARLEKKWLVMFINSSGFLERNQKSFSKSSGTLKSQQFVSEHTFINSHQAILFRKFLQTRVDDDDFMRYLKIKSMSEYSNLGIKFSKEDFKFWYEVQKYKGMFHAHTLDSILDSKVTAIIDCFFNSTVPPQLQIDIPLSLAEQVARKPAGPYLFRESQAVIFKLLYSGWKEFKNFIIGLNNNQIKLALDRLERENIASRRRKWEQEERFRKEEERRRLLLPRFETMEEREQRHIQEKELEEFGPTAVEFRLSTPDPSYMYYTDLPTKKRPRSVINITKPGSARRHAKKGKTSKKKTVTVQVTESPSVNASPWIQKMKEKNLIEDFPIVEMKLCGSRRASKKEEEIETKLPVSREKVEVGMSLKQCLTSPAVTGRNKTDSSKTIQPTAMKTIRMQLQVSTSGAGDSFAYGGALPNDSYLTKTEQRLELNFL